MPPSEPASAAARLARGPSARRGLDGFLLTAAGPRLALAAVLSAALWLAFRWATA